MPIYASPYGSTARQKRTGFWNQPSTSGSVINAAPPGVAGSGDQQDPFNGPGSVDFNLTDPQGSVQQGAQETGDVFSGLKSFLFGTDQPDQYGHHGGVLGIGNVPVVGDVLRGVASVPGVAGQAVGAVAGAAGEALSRIPNPMDIGGAQAQQIKDQFDALPESSQAKQDALKQIADDGGLFGTGLFDKHLSLMSNALVAAQEENGTTDVFSGLFKPVASIGDYVGNLFGAMSVPVRLVERGLAGTTGASGTNRLTEIVAVGSGNGTFHGGPEGLTPVEQRVYDMYTSGQWTDQQSLDYLASHGAGFSHDPMWEIAGNIFLDPTIVASFGAGAVAKLGRVGMTLLDLQKGATEALDVARAASVNTALSAAERAAAADRIPVLENAVNEFSQGIRQGSGAAKIGPLNIPARLATTKVSGDIARSFGSFYQGLEGTRIGQAAKIVRTIVDPLHALGSSPKAAAAIEEGSIESARATANAYGEFTNIDVGHHLAEMDGIGQQMLGNFTDGFATYSANTLRRVAGRGYRATQMLRGQAESLIESPVFASLRDAMDAVSKRTMVQLEEEAGRFVKRDWGAPGLVSGARTVGASVERENLAERLATLWGGMTQEEWLAELAKPRWTGEKLSMLHAATYGTAVKQLQEARAAVRGLEQAGTFSDRLHRLVLLNKRTLTDLGAQGIVDRIAEATSSRDKVAIIEDAMRQYPELANFVRDTTSDSNTINEFLDMIERRKNYLPAQIRNEERASLPAALAEFDQKTRNVFTIGFRPEDRFLWGIEPGTDGVLHEIGDPWLDQVSTAEASLHGYMPVREAAFNVAGKTVPQQFVGKAARLMDGLEAAGRIAMHGVTGKMVTQAAHTRFVEGLTSKFEHAGLTTTDAENVWKALMDKVDDSENISGLRGLSDNAIWNAAAEVISNQVKRAGLDRRTLLVHVMQAYDGDLRYIGLTQKFTGKAKLLAAQLTGGNTAGVIAEHLWPLLKFRLNAFFQLQEKIEPWVLNAQRGIYPAFGTRMTDADRAVASIYRNFVDKNLVNMADTDIAELAKQFGWGKGLEHASQAEGGKIAFIRQKMESLTEVQGVKQLNMLRTWRHGVGREMRAVWEQALPGEWDKMLREARLRAGEVINEDDFAVQMAAENIAANDILVRHMVDASGAHVSADFANAIKVGQWAAPQTLGEMRPLDIDHMVQTIAIDDRRGRRIETQQQLREALASGQLDMNDVTQALRAMNAHPDYVQRVETALTFSWRNFWQEAQDAFNLTEQERTKIEAMFRGIAQSRDMTPVEYLSQVYSPVISRGATGGPGSLGDLVEFARGTRTDTLPNLAHLSVEGEQGSIYDLYKQMGAIMAHHLDPSAKRAFLLDMFPDLKRRVLADAGQPGGFRMDLADIESMWDSNATDALSQRVMHFLQGQPGTGEHALVRDPTSGVARIRDGATAWREQAGRPRAMQRVVYADNPALGAETARAYDEFPITTAAPTEADLAMRPSRDDIAAIIRGGPSSGLAGGAFKSGFTGLPQSMREAYQAYVAESRRLYNYLTDDLHVAVSTSRTPYASADALRADLARGRLKVPASGYWHPVMRNEDLMIQRAVHDAFGYGQEANVLGSEDALFSAAGLYSDQARSVLMSDHYAKQAWEKYSDQVIPQAVAEPQTVAEYEARYGRAPDSLSMATSADLSRIQTRTLGMGVRSLPEPMQRELLGTISNLRFQFPGVALDGLDVAPLPNGTLAATLGWEGERPTMVLGRDAGWQTDEAARQATLERRRTVSEGPDMAVPGTVSSSTTGDIYHEFGHIVDIHLKDEAPAAARKAINAVLDTINPDDLSVYAGESREEKFAELFDLAFNPENMDLLDGSPAFEAVQNFRKALADAGIWNPKGVPVPVNPLAGQTIAAANAGGAGIRAESRVGILPQDLLDRLTENFLGSGRYAESNPDVARMAGYLQDHMQMAASHVLEHGTSSEFAHLFDHLSGMPVEDRVPFNYTEARLWNLAVQSMASKWEDAFRLQYFAQNRSMFQRSINHPMFGLYPASYMWGKVGPELIRFIATEPFGIRTGAVLKSLADLQQAVAVQRQYDPDFNKVIDGIGNNAAIGFLGYMLPATPWSVPASYPAWMRDMAQQGLANQQAAAAGGVITDDNFITPLTAVSKRVFPYSTTVPWFGRALNDLGSALPWNQQEPQSQASGGKDAMGNVITQQPAAPSLAAPVGAVDLAPVLEQQMRDLQSLLH